MPRNSVARYGLTNRLTRLSDCLDVSRIMARRDRESRPSDEKLVSREREGAHKASCVRDYLSAMAALDAPTSGRSGPTPVPTRAQSTYLVSLKLLLVADGGATALVRRDGHGAMGLSRNRHRAALRTHRTCLKTSKSPRMQRPHKSKM